MTAIINVPATEIDDFIVYAIFEGIKIYTCVYKEGSFGNRRYNCYIEVNDAQLLKVESEYQLIKMIK